MYLIASRLQRTVQTLQGIHSHPWALRTTATGRIVAGCGRDNKFLLGRYLLQSVKNTLISRHNNLGLFRLLRCINYLSCGAD